MSYLRRVGVMSLAKFFALWGAVVGFILAIVPSIAFIVVGFSNSMNGASLGLLSLILFPLLYAICGLLGVQSLPCFIIW